MHYMSAHDIFKHFLFAFPLNRVIRRKLLLSRPLSTALSLTLTHTPSMLTLFPLFRLIYSDERFWWIFFHPRTCFELIFWAFCSGPFWHRAMGERPCFMSGFMIYCWSSIWKRVFLEYLRDEWVRLKREIYGIRTLRGHFWKLNFMLLQKFQEIDAFLNPL